MATPAQYAAYDARIAELDAVASGAGPDAEAAADGARLLRKFRDMPLDEVLAPVISTNR